eukprot:Selendium_serpulae@DN10844_c0_g1_i1.p1
MGVELGTASACVVLSLSRKDHKLIVDKTEALSQWNYKWRDAGMRNASFLVEVLSCPSVVDVDLEPSDIVAFAASDLVPTDILKPKAVFKILASKACRRAVKFGDPLSEEEAAALLADLSQCNFPFQCAHGRPTIYPLRWLKERRAAAAAGSSSSSAPRSVPAFYASRLSKTRLWPAGCEAAVLVEEALRKAGVQKE